MGYQGTFRAWDAGERPVSGAPVKCRRWPYQWDQGHAWPRYHQSGQLQFAVHINAVHFVVKVSLQKFGLGGNAK